MRPFNSKGWRIAALVVRMLLGAFFIVSAVSKWLDIDHFEIYVFSYNILPLNLSFLAARLLIVAECVVGIALMANIWKRLVDVTTMLMLAAFTLFLGYATLIGRTDSCHCMGSVLQIDPTQSILKNAGLMLAMVFAMGSKPWKWRPKWYVWLPIMLAPAVALFINSAPDNWLFGASEEVFNQEELDKAISPEGELAPLAIDKGNYVLAFLTPTCPYCKMADEKLAHICSRHELDSTAFVYLTPREDSTVALLTIDTTSFIRPSHIIDVMTWSMITYGQRPMIFLIEDGKVKATCHYRNINEQQIVEFLNR